MEQKAFKTISEQVDILRKRGVTVPNDRSIEKYLGQENYYNIINGYKDLFLLTIKTEISDETYKKGTSFFEIKYSTSCCRWNRYWNNRIIIRKYI